MMTKNKNILTAFIAIFLLAQFHLAMDCGDTHLHETGHNNEIGLHDHICLHSDVETSEGLYSRLGFNNYFSLSAHIAHASSSFKVDYLSPSPREPPVS